MASRERKLFGRFRTEVIGDRIARAALKALGPKIRREIMVAAMEKGMEPMFQAAMDEIEVATGNLLGHLVEKTTGKTKGRVLVDVKITKVKYAGFHEFGTKHQVGAHDLQRAFDATKDQAVAIALQGIADGIERYRA